MVVAGAGECWPDALHGNSFLLDIKLKIPSLVYLDGLERDT